MTPHELIVKLVNQVGPCTRFCAYCSEQYDTSEVKECVEGMYRQIYQLQQDKDHLMEAIVRIRKAYKDATGEDYKDDEA